MRIGVVTDSTADIPEELAQRYNIHSVPAILIIDGQGVEDGKGISRKTFYQRLPQMSTPPTTASPSPGAFEQTYEELLHRGCQKIVSIHAASTLSAIYSAAKVASQRFANRVQVIDSQQISLGLGFQVLAAAEAILKGAPLNQVFKLISNIQQRIRVFALLDTLEFLRRSGRVSWATATLGEWLNLKPMIELRWGKVSRLGQARTWRKGVHKLHTLLESLGPLERLAILHSNAEGEARKFIGSLSSRMPSAPLVVNVTTIIGTHVGPHGLGFTALPRS